MKKLFAILLVLTLTFSAVNAFALVGTDYSVVTTSTYTFIPGHSPVLPTNYYWYITITEGNVSPTHRFVMRLHCGADTASPKWVYEGNNPANRYYNKGYGTDSANTKLVQVRGRLDDRDSGELIAKGRFVH